MYERKATRGDFLQPPLNFVINQKLLKTKIHKLRGKKENFQRNKDGVMIPKFLSEITRCSMLLFNKIINYWNRPRFACGNMV